MRAIYLAIIVGAASLAGFAGQAQDIDKLHLICLGSGSATKMRSTHVYAQDSDGNSGWGNAVSRREVPFDDQVNIDIEAGEDRIRMPRSMLPPLHGGDGGWFRLKNLRITDREITASAAVNFMNSPKVRLDRFTGILSLSGRSGDFSAECQPYDPATVQRKF